MKTKNQNTESKELIREMKQMLHKPTMTLESMIFSGMNEEGDDEDKFAEEMPSDDMSSQNIPVSDSVDVTDSINKIRQIALQAIAKLADNPTSEHYQLLKKVWNLVDKAFENKDNKIPNGE